MKNGYKNEITQRIRESVNAWLEELKKKHSELLLTKQWKILFPRGFQSGHNTLPVITSSKKGQHLVAEVEFVLPEDLELDMDTLQLTLKNEPFKTPKRAKDSIPRPVPLDEPLELLNELVSGVNDFLSSLNIGFAPGTKREFSLFNTSNPVQSPVGFTGVKTVPLKTGLQGTPPLSLEDENIIEKVKKEMLQSAHLPDWFKTIESKEVWDQLLQRLAEGFLHYRKKLGRPIDLKEYFGEYTDYLKRENKLHHWCKYKGKSVRLDENSYCTESYCSKKPYKGVCPRTVLKFGPPEKTIT